MRMEAGRNLQKCPLIHLYRAALHCLDRLSPGYVSGYDLGVALPQDASVETRALVQECTVR